ISAKVVIDSGYSVVTWVNLSILSATLVAVSQAVWRAASYCASLSLCVCLVWGCTLTRDTLQDPLSSPLQWCHRRVQPQEKTILPHHSAHRCTCRWRMTNPPFSQCIPDDRRDGDAHNPADPDRGTCPCSAGHTCNGGCV